VKLVITVEGNVPSDIKFIRRAALAAVEETIAKADDADQFEGDVWVTCERVYSD
jgi:hypothetical protein